MKLKIALVVTTIVAVLCLIPTPTIHAQNVYATIHGTVTDTTGAVIPGAAVTATNTATNIRTTVTTDNNGYYVFPQLQTGGPYTVTISAPNFQKFQSTGVALPLNANLNVSAALKPGSSTTVIQVQAAAVQVETSDTQLKSDITGATMEALPLLSRDPVALQKTAPGVVESSDRFGTFSTNGSQTPQNAFILDGTDINDGPLQTAGITPNIDALAEMQVVGSTLNPEYSRNSGAIVSETIKSGTNSFHGSGFEFYRDTFLNNGNYFSPTRPPFHQNVYGGTLGGPVLRDKLFFFLAYQGYRNATATTNFTNTFSPAEMAGSFTGITGNVDPTNNPSGNVIPVDTIPGCPKGTPWASCAPSGNLTIPTSAFDPTAYAIAQQYAPPQTTTVGGIPGNFFNSANTAALDQGIIRIDFHLSSHDTLWASTIFQSNPDMAGLPFDGASVPGFGMRDARHFKVFSAAYTHTFSPTMLNDLRAGYYRFNYAAVYPQNLVQPSSLGFNITPQSSTGAGVPVMNILNGPIFGFSNDGPQPRKDENYDFNDNFTKIVGGHSLKFGAHVEKFVVSNPFFGDNNGSYNYNGGGLYSSGNPVLDYFLGIPDSYTQESGGFIDAIAWEYYAYAQDSWKVNDSLTLNYGLAWDAEAPNSNHQFGGIGVSCYTLSDRTSGIFPGGPPGLLWPGDKGCNNMGGPTTKWNHIAPRLGFAWSPASGPKMLIGTNGNHDFSLRGGFGVYYNRDQEEGSLQNLSSPPFSLDSSGVSSQIAGTSPGFANPFVDIYDPALAGVNPFPFVPPQPGATINWPDFDGLDINAFDSKYTVPVVYNFNLNVQRSIPGAMVLQVGYVGSLGRHLASVYDADPITPAGHAACLADPACVSNRTFIHPLFPQYTALADITSPVDPVTGIPYYYGVGAQATLASSNYNSLQVQLQKARTHGLTFNISYTYSHALDNSSNLESSGFNGRGINFVPGYQYLSYGDSDFDARQRLVAYYTYEVPLTAGMKEHMPVREILGGWTFSGITAVQTGFPITVMELGDYNSLWCDGYFYYYCPDSPDTSTFDIKSLAPRPLRNFGDGPGNYWFDPTVFSPEPIGTFGNTKRNFFHGPGFNYSNMSLAKGFALGRGEARYLQLFVQAYNVFNHANFAQPDANFLDGTFGAITSVIQPANDGGDPQPGRAVQIGGKIAF